MSPGTRSPTTSMPILAWTSGTGLTRSSVTESGFSARTSSTAGATRRWGAPGVISTSPRSGARRSGRTPRRATPRHRCTRGGTTTMRTNAKEAPRRALLPGDRPLDGGGCRLASVPEPEGHKHCKDQSGDHHADAGEEGDLPDRPPTVGVEQDRPQGLATEQGLNLAVELGHLGGLCFGRVLAPLIGVAPRLRRRLRVGLAPVDFGQVPADVATERLGLGPGVNLLPCELTNLGLLLRAHGLHRSERDVLRLEPVPHVVQREAAPEDRRASESDQRDRDDGTGPADESVDQAPVHAVCCGGLLRLEPPRCFDCLCHFSPP